MAFNSKTAREAAIKGVQKNWKSNQQRMDLKTIKKSQDECWDWTGATHPFGYGLVRNELGKLVMAHRLSYEIYIGEIQPGLCVLHKCDNPKCTNPNHLFIGTKRENMVDMIQKGRAVHAIGSLASKAILTETDVVNMRQLARNGQTHSVIASMYKVSKSCASHAINGKSWKHIPNPVVKK